ncbi:MAG: hypothetical protein LC798_12660 [Chloroflexi bacterium]|nr:hypothetical protein [Chloroflexota bacterium]
MLYAIWRFRGLDPWAALGGQGTPPAGYHEELLTGFALHAAQQERAIADIAEAFGSEG